MERLRANPQSVLKIYLEQGMQSESLIQRKTKEFGIPLFHIPSSKMDKITHQKNAQGIIADAKDFEYEHYQNLLDMALEKNLTLFFLDNITDPQNLGAMIRSIACLGAGGLILPTHDSVEVTETVLRIASGAENYVPVAKVANLNKALRQAKETGFEVLGTVVRGGESLFECELPFRLAVVIGSEQKGVRDVIRQELDKEITIPMKIETLSFNAAHAVTILAYEIKKQKAKR